LGVRQNLHATPFLWWPGDKREKPFSAAGRRTAWTLTLRAGIDRKIISERLGHANVSITLDIYSHCTANMQQEAAAKIDEALRGVLVG
jgi:integrase